MVDSNDLFIGHNFHGIFCHVSNITSKKEGSLQFPLNHKSLKYFGSKGKIRVLVYTLEMAHMLKWTIYSFFVIPPFPTSSISGSVEITVRISFNREGKYLGEYQTRLYIGEKTVRILEF